MKCRHVIQELLEAGIVKCPGLLPLGARRLPVSRISYYSDRVSISTTYSSWPILHRTTAHQDNRNLYLDLVIGQE